MPIDKRKISADQRELILRFEEGHFGDVKATDIAPGKLTRTITAFANADGGELYVAALRQLVRHKALEAELTSG